jgi:hypothetical protein
LSDSAADFGGGNYLINPRSPSSIPDSYRTRDSSATTDFFTNTGSSLGLNVLARTSSTGYTIYVNGASVATPVRTSSAPTATTMWLCGWNDATTPQFSKRMIPLAFIASGWTGTQVANFYTRAHTLLQGLGTVT